MEQRKAYGEFMAGFMDAVKVVSGGWMQTEEQKARLVDLERNLKHETFRCYPQLFDLTFQANQKLMLEIEGEYSGEGDLDDPRYTRGFVEGLLERLRREWIVVDDVVDVLRADDERYAVYKKWEQRRSCARGLLNHWMDELPDIEDDNDNGYPRRRNGTTFRIYEDPVHGNNNSRSTRMNNFALFETTDSSNRNVHINDWALFDDDDFMESEILMGQVNPQARRRRRGRRGAPRTQEPRRESVRPRWTAIYR